ncbi:MAG TPA: protein-disulfide reductase DsbD domain-containing protein [Dongiaceae bacterium]
MSAAAPPGAAETAASEWVRDNESAVRLVSAVAGVGTESELPIGVEFELQPGWKTYWRTPGDAGFPVAVDWTGSSNLAAAEIAWPAPHRFTLFGLETFGYGGQVLLPVTVRPQQPGQPVRLRGSVGYLVCEEICIPKKADLALEIPAGDAGPSAFAQLVARYQAQVPGDGARHGLHIMSAAIGGTADAPVIEVAARSAPLPFERPDVIIEGPNGFSFGPPVATLAADGGEANFSLPVSISTGIDAALLRQAPVTLTLIDGQRGLEQQITLSAATAAAGNATIAAPAAAGLGIEIILIALIGGFILNFMPCVLPVLSLKLLGVVGHAGERTATRRGFIASSAGIVMAFLILAAALIAVKQAGGAIGWGLQFQHPWFLAAMTLVLVLFAANLWGWFEVPMPAWIGRAGAADHGPGLTGQFFTGMFATLLATPCSAPFVGTAVTFALSRGPAEILLIFAALGVGLALPYLLVAALPGIARLLPRPGAWMIWLRRILGLLLAGTAIWLLTVLASQLNALWLGVTIAGVVLVALLLGLGGMPAAVRKAGVAAGAAMILLPAFLPGKGGGPGATDGDLWRPFEQQAIAGLVKDGKTVFVDVTADWCVTCIVNERLVLNVGASAETLRRPEVVPMKADWTQPDDEIARYLASFGRYGIPFNVVYGPAAPDGVLLPELLSESAVLDAFARASGG